MQRGYFFEKVFGPTMRRAAVGTAHWDLAMEVLYRDLKLDKANGDILLTINYIRTKEKVLPVLETPHPHPELKAIVDAHKFQHEELNRDLLVTKADSKKEIEALLFDPECITTVEEVGRENDDCQEVILNDDEHGEERQVDLAARGVTLKLEERIDLLKRKLQDAEGREIKYIQALSSAVFKEPTYNSLDEELEDLTLVTGILLANIHNKILLKRVRKEVLLFFYEQEITEYHFVPE